MSLPLTRLEKYVQRQNFLIDFCRGKRVLHLGCVGWNDCPVETKIKMAQQSLHALLSRECDCTGVDIDGQSISELQTRGIFSNVREGDVEHLERLPTDVGQFDVVLAGDIIEHISNPGLMLSGVRRLLRPDGRLLVSTPNAFGLPSYLRFLGGRYWEGQQHVLSFNASTLSQLLVRNGYVIESALSGFQQQAAKNSVLFPLAVRVLKLYPKFGGTLIYVCRLNPQPARQDTNHSRIPSQDSVSATAQSCSE